MTDQNEARFCRECGAALGPGDNFCPACGAIVDTGTAGTTPASDQAAASTAHPAPGSNRTLLTLGILTTLWAVGAIFIGADFLLSIDPTITQMKAMEQWQQLVDMGFTEEMMRTLLWIVGLTYLASGILAAPAAYFFIAQQQCRLTMVLCILSGVAGALTIIPLFCGVIFAVLANNNKTAFRS